MRIGRHLTPHSLAGKFLVLQLLVVALVLLVAGLVSVRQATSQFATSSGDRILGAAENLAGNPELRQRNEVADPGRRFASTIEAARVQSGATVVLVADPDRTIIAATDPGLIGAKLTLPDETAWTGRAWDGDLTLGERRLIAASVPTYTDAGSVVGLALVGEEYPSTWSVLVAGVPELLLLIVLAAVAGVAGSLLLARRVKRQTHGLEPAEIANLADHREALLHSISEGVLGVDGDGRVTVVNDSARDLLDLPADCVGRDIGALGLEPDILDVMLGRRKGTDLVVPHRDLVLVVNRRTIRGGGRAGASLGAVTTLRDRSELLAVQRQLGSTRNATDTLRAQTHEFDNQLHIISGLAQLGMQNELKEYVGSLTRRRSEIDLALTAHIDDPALAALLVAKSSLAAESAVQLKVSESTRCPRLSLELSTDLTAVVGNLVDNALDAVANSAEATVTVDVVADPESISVTVADTGPGVPADSSDRVFERGFTTKSDAVVGGRGVGLSLVRRICENRGGWVTVRAGAGAIFTAWLPVQPGTAAKVDPAEVPAVIHHLSR